MILQEIAAQWAGQAGTDVSTGFFPLLVRPVGGPGFELHVDDATRAAIVQDLNTAVVNDTTHIRQVLALATETLQCRHHGWPSHLHSVCSWLLMGELLLHQCSFLLISFQACAHA